MFSNKIILAIVFSFIALSISIAQIPTTGMGHSVPAVHVSNNIITETGNQIISESGNNLVTE